MNEEQADAVKDVRATFPDHEVEHEEGGEDSIWVIVRDVAIGESWSPPVIDLAVKLLVTFPTTPPYPFYCESGLIRTDGQAFTATQSTNVDTGDGVQRTQISLRIQAQERFDTENETLGSRFVAVLEWLRNPR